MSRFHVPLCFSASPMKIILLFLICLEKTDCLPSGVIPPQLVIYPIPGFASALDCDAGDYVPVGISLRIYHHHITTINFAMVSELHRFRVFAGLRYRGTSFKTVPFSSFLTIYTNINTLILMILLLFTSLRAKSAWIS